MRRVLMRLTPGQISVFAFLVATAIVAYATNQPRCLSRDEIQQAMYRAPADNAGNLAQPTLVMADGAPACVTAVRYRVSGQTRER